MIGDGLPSWARSAVEWWLVVEVVVRAVQAILFVLSLFGCAVVARREGRDGR